MFSKYFVFSCLTAKFLKDCWLYGLNLFCYSPTKKVCRPIYLSRLVMYSVEGDRPLRRVIYHLLRKTWFRTGKIAVQKNSEKTTSPKI